MNRPDTVSRLLRDHGPLLVQRTLDVPRSTLSRGVAAGRLVHVLPGTFLATAAADDLRWRVAAVGAWNPNAVVCGSAAARLTFWPELRVHEIDVAVRTAVTRAGFRFHRRRIPRDYAWPMHGTMVADPALTALDLIDVHGGEVVDRLLRSRRATLSQLWRALGDSADRSGNPERRRVLLDSRARPWSAAERLAHRILRAAGIRDWRANYRIRVRGHKRYLDIAFPGLRLAIEIDSFSYHASRSAFEEDRARQNDLVLEGWRVLRFTYRMLLDDPDEVVAAVKDMIRQCSV